MLSVIGGTYTEVCLHPNWRRVYGSGCRAAIAVTDLLKNAGANKDEVVRFYSWASDEEHKAIKGLLRRTGVQPYFVKRDQPIEWQYDHSLGPPRLYPGRDDLKQMPARRIEAQNALLFGTVECQPTVEAEALVYDPQASNLAVPFSQTGGKTKRLAIVANMSEGRAIAGKLNLKYKKGDDAAESLGKAILTAEDAEVVVIKNGVRGATVLTRDGKREIQSFRTKKVFPIGSGDIFSGVFAAHWLEMGQDPFQSAHWASVATACYCGQPQNVIPANLDAIEKQLKADGLQPLLPSKKAPKHVYLAGPLITLPEIWFLEEAKRCLKEQGVTVFSPKDEAGLLAHIPNAKTSHVVETVAKDIDGLERCSVVFAIIDGSDAGTLFECGYATAKGKHVIAFAQRASNHDLTMLIGTGCEVHDDFATAVYRAAWVARQQ